MLTGSKHSRGTTTQNTKTRLDPYAAASSENSISEGRLEDETPPPFVPSDDGRHEKWLLRQRTFDQERRQQLEMTMKELSRQKKMLEATNQRLRMESKSQLNISATIDKDSLEEEKGDDYEINIRTDRQYEIKLLSQLQKRLLKYRMDRNELEEMILKQKIENQLLKASIANQ
ncbi:uncharacterized protein LOC134216206 [Armigeres subalbatus]|uniref:uncharacterized protein LOC134216206 n=1 Tax=Armigeres subalbatus TaxID=124917 RepID=UPI002ED459DA